MLRLGIGAVFVWVTHSPLGNRTKMYEYTSSTITTTYIYDDADELTQYTTSTLTMTFTYASDGCLKTKSDGTDTWTYDWDYLPSLAGFRQLWRASERRLTAFKKNSAALVEYGYNPTGTRRYSSDSTLGLTNYFYSGNHPLGDYDSNWSIERSYVRAPRGEEGIAQIDRTSDPNVAYFSTRDYLRSTRELIGISETIKTRYSYDAWGAPTETQLSGNISTRFRYRDFPIIGDMQSTSFDYPGYDRGPWLPDVGRGARPSDFRPLRAFKCRSRYTTFGFPANAPTVYDLCWWYLLWCNEWPGGDCINEGGGTNCVPWWKIGCCSGCCNVRYHVCVNSGGFIPWEWVHMAPCHLLCCHYWYEEWTCPPTCPKMEDFEDVCLCRNTKKFYLTNLVTKKMCIFCEYKDCWFLGSGDKSYNYAYTSCVGKISECQSEVECGLRRFDCPFMPLGWPY